MASTFVSLSSSIACSPIPHAKSNPIFQVTRCSTSLKEVEFPSLSETSFSDGKRNKPIRGKKNKNKNNDKALVHTLAETFTYCIHKKQWLKALEFFDILREQPYYEPKEVTYVKLIVLLGKSGQPHCAHQLFDTIKEDGCETTGLYTALIAAYCRNYLIDEAFLVLDKMKNLPHCHPDVSTYSTLIKACVNALKFELVGFLSEDMAERSIMLNTVTQNIVLNSYANAAMFDQIEKLLSFMMESAACKPDVFTMNTVIGAFGKRGEIVMMEKWYERLCNFGVQPETYTFNILIGAYGKKRMYDKMSSVMQQMRKLQCQWTVATYNNVIEAFADVGDVKSMEHTFDQMHEEGLIRYTVRFEGLN
ncbi:hypothetical protein HN51_012420 [Arachis hypogaea]